MRASTLSAQPPVPNNPRQETSATPIPAPIPRGVADYFWGEAARRRTLEADLLALFRAWGYGDVLPPAFEYVETLAQRANPELQAELYRFVDRDGSALALRADMTIPVARLVATRLHDLPMPQRFCYAGSVFRYADTQAGMQREFWQAGVELIGAADPAADAEVLALTVRALEAAGLAKVQLAVGHLGYFHGLLEALALPQHAQEALLVAVDRNSEAALIDFLRTTNLSDVARTAVAGVPTLSGDDPRALLERADKLCLNDAMSSALDNLRAILRALHGHALDERVHVDLTEIHNLGYYTGMTFEALSPRLGFALASGGRYDHLVGTFGAPQPAVGAALILDRLLLALRPEATPARPLAPQVLAATQGDPAAHAAVEVLRSAGLTVAVDLANRSAQPLADYAQKVGARVTLCWSNGAFQRCCSNGVFESLPTGDALARQLLGEVRT
jgi:ATP phosphoribosyltransferase regulatory subunit